MNRRWDNRPGLSAPEVMAYSAGVFLLALGKQLGPVGILAPVGRLVRGVPAWVDRRLDARCDLGTVD